MARKSQKQLTYELLELVGRDNPYNRSGENAKNEYYIYQMGYMASLLASIAQEDPYWRARLKRHLDQGKDSL
jgi:hypothetical protein